MTTSAHDLDGVRATIQETRADLAGTTAALAAKVDVKARVKATAATAASHVKDSTTGVTRRLVAVVAPKEPRQPAIGSRVESRGTRLEVWRARRAAGRERAAQERTADGGRIAGGDRRRLADRGKAWLRERKARRSGRSGQLQLEGGRPAGGRLGDGW